MADKKISQLTNASTPLAGTEVLPIVQSSTTVKVATNDLTVKNVRSNATTGILQIAGPAAAATRTMTVPDANFTVARTDAANSFTNDQTLANGNLVVGTSGKGIDFSANTHAAGMTSELLNWYEEGAFTPTLILGSGSVTYTTQRGSYTRIGRLVTLQIFIEVNVASSPSGTVQIGGLPFVISSGQKGAISIWTYDMAVTSKVWVGESTAGSSLLRLFTYDAGTVANPGADIANGCGISITASYEV